MGSIDKTTRSCRWLSRVLVTSSRFENISVEEPIARHLNKTNLLIELKGEEKEIYGACNAEIVP